MRLRGTFSVTIPVTMRGGCPAMGSIRAQARRARSASKAFLMKHSSSFRTYQPRVSVESIRRWQCHTNRVICSA